MIDLASVGKRRTSISQVTGKLASFDSFYQLDITAAGLHIDLGILLGVLYCIVYMYLFIFAFCT